MKKHTTTIDFGYPTGAHGRIPSFNSVEEEAEFWDTHDFTDYAAESTPVEVTIGGDLAERLTLRLDQADREKLALRAKRLGVGPSTLARMWIKEQLQREAEAEPSSR